MTYTEIYETNGGYEAIIWASKADCEADVDNSKAVRRYPACWHCVEGAYSLEHDSIGIATIRAVWVDDDGATDGAERIICRECLENGAHMGPHYVEVEAGQDLRRCHGCNNFIDPHAQTHVVYCGRCGDPR